MPGEVQKLGLTSSLQVSKNAGGIQLTPPSAVSS